MPIGLSLRPQAGDPLRPTAIEASGTVYDCDGVPTGAVVLADAVTVAFGDGLLRFFHPGERPRQVQIHAGAVLALAADGDVLLTGGDDGRLCRTTTGDATEVLADFGPRWVDHVAAAPDGARAASVGRTAHVWDAGTGREHRLDHPSTVGGLAFDRRGARLAVAHYGGATIWTRGRRNWKASHLKWAGSHVGVTWSPDNRFLITMMQETALHGWRLRDRADMRMSGYPAKPKSVAWAGKIPFLVTSGASEAICWPFEGTNGPMGREPLTLCPGGRATVTAVAAIPGRDAILAGFSDGSVQACGTDELAAPVLVKRRGGEAIVALAVTQDGWMLAAAEDGRVLWAPLEAGT